MLVRFRLLVVSSMFLLVAACCTPGWAQPGQRDNPLSWDRNVRGLFSRYCWGCHKAEDSNGGVDLASDTDPRRIRSNRDTWETVQFVLMDKSMPPDGAKQPSEEERKWMLGFLEETLGEIDCQTLTDPGPPPLRRLNRVEYDNAIFDLTGLDLSIAAETFPPDTSSYGFDNIGAALAMTPVQVEQYHSAAGQVVEALLALRGSATGPYQRIIGDDSASGQQQLRQRLQRFSDKAFRRPTAASWVERLMTLYQQSRDHGEDHETAMGHVVTAVLMAPQFLLRIEQNQPDEGEPYRVDDYELASRLSFFLWSRPPDAPLLKLAARDKLRQPEVLRQQMERMLRDARSEALVKNFFGQWLGLRSVLTHPVDSDQFPELDDRLRHAMLAEAEACLMEMIQSDRPVIELIDSDYTYLNASLAQHYQFSSEQMPAQGEAEQTLQRISLTDRRRGGLLTTAALLMVQSDPNRTNIPRRGNYIADRILGDPPPPPPPDAPELETVADGRQVPLRERFEKHSASPNCASCHAKIDPIGFALENYDAVGRWRAEDAGQPIDSTGTMPDGFELSGAVSLKDMLLESRQAFVRTLAKQMLIYALGRGLMDADRCIIESIVSADAAQPLRFAELTWIVISSRPFLNRRNPDY